MLSLYFQKCASQKLAASKFGAVALFSTSRTHVKRGSGKVRRVQVKSQDLATGWAKEVFAMSQRITTLIGNLPDVKSTEEDELRSVAAAIQHNNSVGQDLQSETELTGRLLALVRALHGALADRELKASAQVQDVNMQFEF